MTNVLVVYKKNFESIHDESLAQLEAILGEMKTTHQLRVELRARERVRRADFIGRDLVVVLGLRRRFAAFAGGLTVRQREHGRLPS